MTSLTSLVGLPAPEGVSPDSTWFVFALPEGGVPGVWILMPIADRTAFDASVVGWSSELAVSVDSGHALVGTKPVPACGGELPPALGSLLSLRAETGAIYRRYAQAIEAGAVESELERARAAATDEENPPPFHWDEIRQRVMEQHATAFALLDQSERASLAAENGFVNSQLRLGELYAGRGEIDRDRAKADEWVRRAAEQGSVLGMRELGASMTQAADEDGAAGDDPRYVEAAKWFQNAIEKGDDQLAASSLAIAYRSGHGVEQDYAHSAELFRHVSEGGLEWHRSYALFQLGQYYRIGLGVEKDDAKPLEWFRKSVAMGS